MCRNKHSPSAVLTYLQLRFSWLQLQDAELGHIYAACVRECLARQSELDAILVRFSVPDTSLQIVHALLALSCAGAAAAAAGCTHALSFTSSLQVGLSDTYEHLRTLLPDPEAEWVTRRGSSANVDSPPTSTSGRPPGAESCSQDLTRHLCPERIVRRQWMAACGAAMQVLRQGLPSSQ